MDKKKIIAIAVFVFFGFFMFAFANPSENELNEIKPTETVNNETTTTTVPVVPNNNNNNNNAVPVVPATPVVTDTTAPVITLIGEKEVIIRKGESYTDAGAKAIDETDGDITDKIIVDNTVDTLKSGEYTITYNVTDEALNEAKEVTRTVKVVDVDKLVESIEEATTITEEVKGKDLRDDLIELIEDLKDEKENGNDVLEDKKSTQEEVDEETNKINEIIDQIKNLEFRVIFYDYNKIVLKDVKVKFMESTSSPNEPTRVGYVFTKWSGKAENVTNDLEIIAEYEKATDTQYVINTYIKNVGEGYALTTEIKAGTTEDEVSAIVEEKEGFTFNENKSNVKGSIEADGSLELNLYYERNSYSLIVDGKGTSKLYEEAIGQLAEPTKNGYTFVDWDNEIPTTMPAKNVEVNSTWETVEYTINYELNGGINSKENPSSYTIETSTITLKPASKEGYVFAGWILNGSATATIEECSYGNITLVATYTEATDTEYKVVYKYEKLDGTYDEKVPVTKTGTTNATAVADAKTVEGYTVDEKASKISAAIKADGSTVLTVVYNRNTYSLTVNKDSGVKTVTANENYKFGESVKIEYTLNEGYEKATISGDVKTYEFIMPAKNVVATITTTAKDYVISFVTSPSTQKVADVTKKYNTTITSLPIVENFKTASTEYEFVGWATTIDGEVIPSYEVKGNATLYAVWTTTTRKYNVNYYSNYGENVIVETKEVEYGSKVDLTVSTTRDASSEYSYTLEGWNTSKDATTTLSSKEVTSNTNLYAIWSKKANAYTVSVSANNTLYGSVVTSDGKNTYDYNSKVTINMTPASKYYVKTVTVNGVKTEIAAGTKTYEFVMPAKSTTVVVEFAKIDNNVILSNSPFSEVYFESGWIDIRLKSEFLDIDSVNKYTYVSSPKKNDYYVLVNYRGNALLPESKTTKVKLNGYYVEGTVTDEMLWKFDKSTYSGLYRKFVNKVTNETIEVYYSTYETYEEVAEYTASSKVKKLNVYYTNHTELAAEEYGRMSNSKMNWENDNENHNGDYGYHYHITTVGGNLNNNKVVVITYTYNGVDYAIKYQRKANSYNYEPVEFIRVI